MMVMAVTGSASRIARNTFTDSALRRSSILRSNSSYLNGIVPLRVPSGRWGNPLADTLARQTRLAKSLRKIVLCSIL